ncbi:MAG TPA: hypothetical protein VFL64_19640 [Rhizobacter sp.]|nr:hypothetical protein [Rhizobacter sp.]
MEKIAVFLNDAAHAQSMLAPLLQSSGPSHWIMVACPPTLTRHIGRWVSGPAKQQWRERWSAELFAQVEPLLKAQHGSRVERMLAKRPLFEVATRLDSRLGSIKVFDARRPRIGRPNEPLTADAPAHELSRWTYPVAVTTGLSAMLALAD